MSASVLVWPVDELRRVMAQRLPGIGIEVVGRIDSSNTELMRRARAGRLTPALLVAEIQTEGRGRLGRRWNQGEAGSMLAFSLGLPLAPRSWSGLSLAVGVAVAESLHPEIGLKWPNDLWWQDRKLAGILVETAGVARDSHYAVVGVGVNIAPVEDPGLAQDGAALQELLPGVDAPMALARVVPRLAEAIQAFESDGFAAFAGRFADRDVLRDRVVRLSDGVFGRACGVAADGALQVETAQGLQEVRSAEVSVRPQRARPSPEQVN